MLFDLQGKRRRVVQATYLTLAVLMGGGLVLFGIGGDVSGGLFDAFSGNRGSSGNDIIQKRIDRNEANIRKGVRVVAARKELVRDYYGLATSKTPPSATGFGADAKGDLAKAASNWQAYLKATSRPDGSLARVALQIYDPTALNRPKLGQQAAQIVAEQENSAAAYLNLVQYATLAGDTRTANLAGLKAIDLAPKGQKKAVRAQVKQAKTPPQAGQGAQATPTQ